MKKAFEEARLDLMSLAETDVISTSAKDSGSLVQEDPINGDGDLR